MFSDNDSVHLAYGEANLDFPVKTLKYRYTIKCLLKVLLSDAVICFILSWLGMS